MATDLQIQQRADELGQAVQDMMKRFQALHASALNGPHVSLNHQELRVLEFLGQEGPQMMRAVAEHLALAVNSVTTIADGMEQKELIRRQRSEEDRRIVRVELTDHGRDSYEALQSVKREWFCSMLAPLTPVEQQLLIELYRKIARAGDA